MSDTIITASDTITTEEPKPCPFCGGHDIRFDCHPGAGQGMLHRGDDVWSMCCFGCGATFPNRYAKNYLLKDWNRRVGA